MLSLHEYFQLDVGYQFFFHKSLACSQSDIPECKAKRHDAFKSLSYPWTTKAFKMLHFTDQSDGRPLRGPRQSQIPGKGSTGLGKMLYESPQLKVYLNKTTKQVILQTTIDCSPTIERELLQLQGDMGRVIGANYSEIIKVFNSKTDRV